MPVHRVRSCGKVRFRDRREALNVLHHAQKARYWATLDGTETRRAEVRCYTCERCSGVHLTSQPA